eukprot:12696448-Alexandrium_andersonii.AAC.1
MVAQAPTHCLSSGVSGPSKPRAATSPKSRSATSPTSVSKPQSCNPELDAPSASVWDKPLR